MQSLTRTFVYSNASRGRAGACHPQETQGSQAQKGVHDSCFTAQMPGSYVTFAKLIGLSQEEIKEILTGMWEQRKDVSAATQDIQNAKERRSP